MKTRFRNADQQPWQGLIDTARQGTRGPARPGTTQRPRGTPTARPERGERRQDRDSVRITVPGANTRANTLVTTSRPLPGQPRAARQTAGELNSRLGSAIRPMQHGTAVAPLARLGPATSQQDERQRQTEHGTTRHGKQHSTAHGTTPTRHGRGQRGTQHQRHPARHSAHPERHSTMQAPRPKGSTGTRQHTAPAPPGRHDTRATRSKAQGGRKRAALMTAGRITVIRGWARMRERYMWFGVESTYNEQARLGQDNKQSTCNDREHRTQWRACCNGFHSEKRNVWPMLMSRAPDTVRSRRNSRPQGRRTQHGSG